MLYIHAYLQSLWLLLKHGEGFATTSIMFGYECADPGEKKALDIQKMPQ